MPLVWFRSQSDGKLAGAAVCRSSPHPSERGCDGTDEERPPGPEAVGGGGTLIEGDPGAVLRQPGHGPVGERRSHRDGAHAAPLLQDPLVELERGCVLLEDGAARREGRFPLRWGALLPRRLDTLDEEKRALDCGDAVVVADEHRIAACCGWVEVLDQRREDVEFSGCDCLVRRQRLKEALVGPGGRQRSPARFAEAPSHNHVAATQPRRACQPAKGSSFSVSFVTEDM